MKSHQLFRHLISDNESQLHKGGSLLFGQNNYMRVTRFHILVISLVLNNKSRERIISTKLLGTRGTTRNNQEILMKRIEVHTELTKCPHNWLDLKCLVLVLRRTPTQCSKGIYIELNLLASILGTSFSLSCKTPLMT